MNYPQDPRSDAENGRLAREQVFRHMTDQTAKVHDTLWAATLEPDAASRDWISAVESWHNLRTVDVTPASRWHNYLVEALDSCLKCW